MQDQYDLITLGWIHVSKRWAGWAESPTPISLAYKLYSKNRLKHYSLSEEKNINVCKL